MTQFLMHSPLFLIGCCLCVPFGYVLAMGCAALGAMLKAHTERTRTQASLLRSVVASFGLKDEAFAAMLGITPARLSRFWAGLDGLDVKRLWELDDEFHAAWQQAQVALRGGRIYEADDLAFVRGLASLPRPQMLQMTAAQIAKKREGVA